MSIILIHPYPGRPEADVRLSGILSHALADREGRTIRTAEELDLRPGDRVLFALALDGAGQNLEYYRMLSRLRREPDLLEGCTAALIVDGPGELYTKSTAGELALAADMAGCALIGRPLVEGTGSLANFRVQGVYDDDLMGTCVVVDHGDGLTSTYCNLSAKPTVSEGDTVSTGTVLGVVGETAIAESSRPSHLHLEMAQDGKAVDPVSYLPQR